MNAAGVAVQAADPSPQASLAHQARHPLVAAAHALAPEHFVHARRAVASAAIAVDALDQQQFKVIRVR